MSKIKLCVGDIVKLLSGSHEMTVCHVYATTELVDGASPYASNNGTVKDGHVNLIWFVETPRGDAQGAYTMWQGPFTILGIDPSALEVIKPSPHREPAS